MNDVGSPLVVARARNGRGAFATRSFERGETVLRLDGRIVHYEVLWRRQGSKFAANCFRYARDTYLDPGDGPGSFVNHSCYPNAAIVKTGRRLYLVAAKRIGAGAEVTIDYSTTIGDDDVWTMRCNCGHRRCRKTVRNFGSLPAHVRRRYLDRDMVPAHIVSTLGRQP